MDQTLEIDVDAYVATDLRDLAVLLAIQENPMNATHPRSAKDIVLAVARNRLWANGRTLRIRFISGNPIVQRRIVETAKEWTNHANLEFDFDNHPDADIRIAFSPKVSWSYVGTDSKVIPQHQPTMNFGWLYADSPQDTYSKAVLHEFGHAIGCIHEHQTPDAGIRWNKPVVYEYYRHIHEWDKATVEHNIFYTYDRSTSNHTVFDPESIMVYPIPKEHTLDGYEVKWNSSLSETDKAFIAQVYPCGGRDVSDE